MKKTKNYFREYMHVFAITRSAVMALKSDIY